MEAEIPTGRGSSSRLGWGLLHEQSTLARKLRFLQTGRASGEFWAGTHASRWGTHFMETLPFRRLHRPVSQSPSGLGHSRALGLLGAGAIHRTPTLSPGAPEGASPRLPEHARQRH